MPPPWPDPREAAAGTNNVADLAACRVALRGGSRTFFAASLLLPRRVFEPAAALYAFCRSADDAVDLNGESVAGLRLRLHRAYAGHPLPIAADRALSAVVIGHAIPPELPEALLEGFAWDSEGRRYEDLDALLGYAARVAGSVGAMMAMLMGAREPEIVARACDLGVAMQLSNIARDVGEDARAGRLYLPLRWLREVGIDPDAWLARPVFTDALGTVIGRLLREADTLYARADVGIARLPASCRPGIQAARNLYQAIGRVVEERGLDSVSQRAFVPPARKTALLARGLFAARAPVSAASLPTLEAVGFLVDAVVGASPLPRRRAEVAAKRSIDDRIAWLVDLFLRLDERRRVVGR